MTRLIRGGRVVTAADAFDADVLIDGESVVAVGTGLEAEGVSSFKVFMAYKGALMVDDEQMLAVLEQTGRTGGLVMVHCENGDAVYRYQKEALAAGNTDPRFHASTRPPAVEGEATSRAI